MYKFRYRLSFFLIFLFLLDIKIVYAISGKDIKFLISDFLLKEGINSDPVIKENREFKDCNHDLNIKPIFKNYKTVIVTCKKPLKWQIAVRTNAYNYQQSKGNYNNFDENFNKNLIKVITLKNNLKKGEVIQAYDLKYDFKKQNIGNGFFEKFDQLIGREINQNLSRGQLIRTRHLKENFIVKEGQSIIIFSNLNGINVRMEGSALENGHISQLIKVKNISSGKIIEGKIINNKKILINY